MMFLGLGLATLGGLIVALSALGVFARNKPQTLEERLAATTELVDDARSGGMPPTSQAAPGVSQQAIGMAQKALNSNKGLEAALGSRLEAAGLRVKPAEWLLAHAGIAFGGALLGLLLSSGNILVTALMLAAGALVPWLYLGMKRKRRLKSFDAQLADVLQLMSGSLSAGLSLAQSADTVVREGTEPVAGEFRRALAEARLGVQIEDAFDSVAERMDSDGLPLGGHGYPHPA